MKTIPMDFPTIEGEFIRMNDDERYDVGKIRFTGYLCQIDASSTKRFEIVDQAWLIMKEIFEKKGYTMTKLGFLIADIH